MSEHEYRGTKITTYNLKIEELKDCPKAIIHSTNKKGDIFENSKGVMKLVGEDLLKKELPSILRETKNLKVGKVIQTIGGPYNKTKTVFHIISPWCTVDWDKELVMT